MSKKADIRQRNIDFIIPWVDGSDPVWDQSRRQWEGTDNETGLRKWNIGESRYRDWELLRYWFRGVEKYAPWVNKVYFISDHQLPVWLNTGHPKLVCVNHDDYIPEKYLPTFSSHCIELNLHRISGLSDRFVYFNDDTFLLKGVQPEDYFKNGLPCDSAIMKPVRMEQNGIRAEINDLYAINSRFSMMNVIKADPFKWINCRYGSRLFSTLLMLPYNTFSGFNILHLPIAYLKDSFEEVWAAFPDLLDETCRHKFRKSTDVNQWLMQYWQFVTGNFHPRSPYIGKAYEGAYQIDEAVNAVNTQKYKMFCFNDSVDIQDFDTAKKKLQGAFNSILPEKSSYECD